MITLHMLKLLMLTYAEVRKYHHMLNLRSQHTEITFKQSLRYVDEFQC